MNNDKYLSVSALTAYLKQKFDTDSHLKTIFLKGEISNFKNHTSGHLYFSIKDEKCKINAIMFSINAKRLNFNPVDGTKVLVIGRVSIYESTGNYQIYIDEMLEDGIGNLYIAFEKLKEELSKEGLFDEKYKKKIPEYPKRVGVVTASTGAAIQDIISTIKRRYPICEVILFPSLVQGEGASSDIAKNIRLAENYNIDTLIVGRGGGSIEDLWPFNEEIVARAIFNCQVPVISAVGHEIDFTIADFVADLRAPTPTAAAEVAVPNIFEVNSHINQIKIRIQEYINQRINYNYLLLETYKNSFVIKNPKLLYENKKQKLDMIKEDLDKYVFDKLESSKFKIEHIKKNYIINNPNVLYKNQTTKLLSIIDKLNLLNPLNIMSKGYSLIYQNDILIKSIKNLKNNDKLKLKLADGDITAIVHKEEICQN